MGASVNAGRVLPQRNPWFLNAGPQKKSFNSYLESYPQGRNALNAHFVLAEIYFEESDMITALEHYQKLQLVIQKKKLKQI